MAKGRSQGHYVTSDLLTGGQARGWRNATVLENAGGNRQIPAGQQEMRNRIFDKIDNLYAAGLINKTQHKKMALQLI